MPAARIQPQGRIRLNLANPLAAKLISSFSAAGAANSASVSVVVNKFGKAVKAIGAAQSIVFPAVSSGTSGTIVMLASLDSGGGAFQYFYDSAGGAGRDLFYKAGGPLGWYICGQNISESIPNFLTAVPSVVVLRWTPTAQQIFSNGALVFSAAATISATGSRSVNLLSRTGGGSEYLSNGTIGEWHQFSGALSDAEVASVSRNPFQVYDGQPALLSAAVAPVGGNATANPPGVSASSAIGSAAASGQAKAAPAGVATAASVGTATANGSTVVSGTATPAGVAASAAVGTASASGQAKAAPAGVSASAAVGTPFATGQAITTAYPAGVQAVASVGIATGKGTATAAPLGVQSQIYVGVPYAYGPFDASSYPKFYAYTLMRADPVSASGAMQGSSESFTLMRSNPLYAVSAMSDAPLNRVVNLI